MENSSLSYSFIKVLTEDKIRLSGLYQSGSKEKTAYIFIHGFMADFYSHDFYHSVSKRLKQQNQAVILAQNRGSGITSAFIRENKDGKTIGSFYERIEESHYDISAFVKYLLDEGYQSIGIIGHSLGTIKAVRYLFEGEYGDKITKLVLLAPFDKNGYMERKDPKNWREYFKTAQKFVLEGKGEELVPVPQFEDFAISYQTYVSWYDETDLGCMWDFYRKDYDFPILHRIKVPVKVILGEKDEFVDFPEFGESASSVMTAINKHVRDVETVLIPDCNHTFDDCEEVVAEEVANF